MISTPDILDIIRAHGIEPEEPPPSDLPASDERELPGIGIIRGDEAIYTTSIREVLGDGDQGETEINEPGIPKLLGDDLDEPDILNSDDPRIREWWDEIERIRSVAASTAPGSRTLQARAEPPEPHCAWYCPIHYFGHAWGIYIREDCVLSSTVEIARFVDWTSVRGTPSSMAMQLLRSGFYVYFLHEQFHHKVESLGFRLLVTSGDRYRPYKSNVYRKSYLTSQCLEESLANAESYRRLSEPHYTKRVQVAIRKGLRAYLQASFKGQPPGYAEAVNFLDETFYRDGLRSLQSQILDGAMPPITPSTHWSIAPNVIRALMDIDDDIYLILPRGGRPIFRPTTVDPGATVSSRALIGALTRHHGYHQVSGGKGSHIKLAKPGGHTIIIPGDRPVLSPGVVKQALHAIGGYPISRLRDLLNGKLAAHA